MLLYLFILPLFLCFLLLLFVFLPFDKKRITTLLDKEKPLVSIFVAARNEEKTIVRCLEALSKLTYSNIEILIGNDHSDDNTLSLVQAFILDKPQFSVFTIEANLGTAKGKSNVLAQLAHKAKGDYFFVTDADTEVPSQWVEFMFEGFDDEVGIVTGITTLKTKRWFDTIQQIDWLYALSLVKVVSDFGFPITSMGNNMAVKKEAYWQTGGYENLPFSITEDFQLFKKIIDKGWGFKNLFQKEVLATSLPLKNFLALYHQRKRWMIGAMQLPFHFLLLLYLQALFVAKAYRKLQQPIPWLQVGLFEFYSTFLSVSMLVFYYLPIKVNWKGRKY